MMFFDFGYAKVIVCLQKTNELRDFMPDCPVQTTEKIITQNIPYTNYE
jgi:hypothetical protein